MIKAVRGTRDLLPPDTALWNFVESVARDVFRAYNFQEIRTPIFESTELFARGVGEETDIVSKEMYTWWDRGHSPGRILERAWLLQYAKNYEKIQTEVKLGHRHADFVAYRHNAPPTIVEVKREFEPRVLLQLREWQMFWEKEHGERPILALAVPEDQAGSARELAPGNLEIQIIDWPEGYESPQSLTLRPENTAGVVRAYIEHKLWDRGLNKLYYIGPQFRRERPQKGRYRQFYQIGAEVIGPASAGSERPLRDAEVLEMLDTLLRRLGIADFTLYINSVGDSKDRAAYNDALRKALEPVVANMCSDCQRRAVSNPLRVFDCKVPEDQSTIQALLRQAGVAFEINPRLVRGLDYYTRTAFEFTHGALGAQNAILGGGRYDGLAELLGSPEPAPGIGFAIGEDRLVMALQGRASETTQKVNAYVAPVGEGMNRNALVLARDLRREGLVIELGDRSLRLKKMFEAASKAGAKYILIVGENEVKADAFALKNLATGEQVSVARGELAQKIQGSS